MTFKVKLVLSIIGIQLGLLVLLSFGGAQLIDHMATSSLQTKANDVSKFLQPVGIVGIQKNDTRWFDRTAKLVLLSEDIDLVKLVDVSGKVLVDEKISTGDIANGFIFRKNLSKGQQVYGQLIVNLSNKAEADAYAEANSFVTQFGIGIGALLLIMGGFVGYIVLRKHESEVVSDIEYQDAVDDAKVHNAHDAITNKEYSIDKSNVVRELDIEPQTEIEPQIDSVSAELHVLDSINLDFELVKEDVEDVEDVVIFPDIVKKSRDATILTNLEGLIIDFNPAAEKLFGYKRDAVLGKNISETLLTDKAVSRYSNFLSSIDTGSENTSEELFESKFRSADGSVLDINVHMVDISSPNGKQVVLYTRDISQQKATENRLNYLAFNDELTDLPNLSLLSDHIRKATFEADANDRQMIVLKLGLDRFKHVNESLGHRFGDYLIRSIASRLKANIRRGDMVSRINGDQFVVALVDVAHDSNIDVLVQKYLDCFIEPFQIESQKIHVNVSIGATLYPSDEKSVDGLLRNAESAMFRAKDKGGNNYQFFSQEMRKISQERLYMENELRKALDLNQFELHYQPQVNLGTGKIIGVEALIRWIHPEMGLVPPLKFIPLAEETGLIVAIGEWVLKSACLHNKQLMEERGESLILAVNLSARQFKGNDLVTSIASILNEIEYPAELLELEITESLLMENMEDVTSALNILSDQGIRISMDDFGTGYSSLSYLKSFPINTLKVDRSFVQDLEDDENNASIVTATIQMAHSLNIDIVAEGVETEGQLKFLATKKCDKIQGYYFSRPLESDALRELLNENREIETQEGSMRLISGFH